MIHATVLPPTVLPATDNLNLSPQPAWQDGPSARPQSAPQIYHAAEASQTSEHQTSEHSEKSLTAKEAEQNEAIQRIAQLVTLNNPDPAFFQQTLTLIPQLHISQHNLWTTMKQSILLHAQLHPLRASGTKLNLNEWGRILDNAVDLQGLEPDERMKRSNRLFQSTQQSRHSSSSHLQNPVEEGPFLNQPGVVPPLVPALVQEESAHSFRSGGSRFSHTWPSTHRDAAHKPERAAPQRTHNPRQPLNDSGCCVIL